MIPEIREKYNSEFKEETYLKFIENIKQSTNNALEFRICETPLFADSSLTRSLVNASNEIAGILKEGEILKGTERAVPVDFNVPNEDSHPVFLQLDFGITKNAKGEFVPMLIELQGFPSLYCFQAFLNRKNRQFYNIPQTFTPYFNGFTYDTYIQILKKVMIGNEDPENVILLEIEPEKQKTYIDFFLTKELLGIAPICISDVIKRGNKIFYKKNGREVQIKRIYNRVIFDELKRTKIDYGFSFMDDLNVKWVGHPNWFYKISKFLLPKIKTQNTPDCHFLNELDDFPEDLENYVLKPLFSFSGLGVQIDINREILESIKNPREFLLQKKVEYAPLIKTPDGYSKTEVRMMFVWDKEPVLVNNLLRTTKGKMVGVDYNKDKTWVGSNMVYHP